MVVHSTLESAILVWKFPVLNETAERPPHSYDLLFHPLLFHDEVGSMTQQPLCLIGIINVDPNDAIQIASLTSLATISSRTAVLVLGGELPSHWDNSYTTAVVSLSSMGWVRPRASCHWVHMLQTGKFGINFIV